jgi:hypothetical protein
MLQSPFLQLTRVGIDKRNLLEARMVIRSYNDHRSAPFSRALVGWHHQLYSGVGADIVMESITLIPDFAVNGSYATGWEEKMFSSREAEAEAFAASVRGQKAVIRFNPKNPGRSRIDRVPIFPS